MPVLWNQLQQATTAALVSQKLSGPEESAHFFTKSYITSMLLSQDPVNNLVLLSTKKIKKGKSGYNIIYKGWLKAFQMMEASPIDLKMIPYLHVSKALVKFWTGMLVSPLLPHGPSAPFAFYLPLMGSLVQLIEYGNIIIFPGNVIAVASGIHEAFNKKKEPLVAKFLVDTYKKHLKSIKGQYWGVLPPPPTTPPPLRGPATGPIPWSGLK